MHIDEDLATIVRQEETLQFDHFNEDTAWQLGRLLYERAASESWPLVIDVSRFDRQLFFASRPGVCFDNHDWVRRKANTVQRFLRSSYRLALELAKAQLDITQRYHLSPADYAWVGGSFPITMRGSGVIGSITVSGLPDREDHQIVVDALCDLLGRERAAYRLPRQDG